VSYRKSRLTAVTTASAAAATSVWVVSFPNENRTIWREAALSGFIARTTWEGSSESARQAEPADAQIPA
jgi:hypothetical protein